MKQSIADLEKAMAKGNFDGIISQTLLIEDNLFYFYSGCLQNKGDIKDVRKAKNKIKEVPKKIKPLLKEQGKRQTKPGSSSQVSFLQN